MVLALGDFAVMVGALAVMVLYRYGTDKFSEHFAKHIYPFLIVFFLWVIAFYVLEIYNINTPFNHRKFGVAMAVNTMIAITFIYLFLDVVEISPRRNLAILLVAFVPLFYGWRFLFTRVIDAMAITKAVAIIGSDKYALELAAQIGQQKRQGFRVAAMVCDSDSNVKGCGSESQIQKFQTVAELKDHIPTLKIDIIIVSDSWYESIYADLYELLPLRIQFYQLTTFWERFLESIPIYSAKESWFLENFNRGTNRGYSFIKRLMDLTVTLIFLPLVLVLAGITALLVKMSSPGPALFSQTRVGRNDQHFTIFKFRSMVVDAEKDGAQWAQERDPRITPVGRFIRATRLDEIPQLWNVLRGDMSIIGPRPERPEFVRQLAREIPHYHLRHLVRPGLTGWAQVRYRYGASTEDAAVKLTYDLYYVKNISAVLDIKIALKTVFTILGGQGR